MSMPKQRADARPAPGMVCKTRSRVDQIAERAVHRIGRQDHDEGLAEALLARWEHGPHKGQDSFEDRPQARKEAKDLIKAARAKAAQAKACQKAAKKETTLTRRLTVQHQAAAAMGRRRKLVPAQVYPVVSTCTAMGERDSQQDRIGEFAALGLFVICDGMGGHPDGDLAAETAVQSLASAIGAVDPGNPHRATALMLATVQADASVFRLAGDCSGCGAINPPHKMSCHGQRTPGTTLTALWLSQGSVWIAHVGDSRAYHIIGGAARQLTKDHTTYGMLTQYVGKMAEPQILGPLPPSGQYLLCSDGLTGALSDKEITILLADSQPSQAARTLVLYAIGKGKPRQDNVSAIVITLGPAAEMRPAVPPGQPVKTTTPTPEETTTMNAIATESSSTTYPVIDNTRGVQDRVANQRDLWFEKQMEREIAARRTQAAQTGKDVAVYGIVESLPWEPMRGRGWSVQDIVTLLEDADFREAYCLELTLVETAPAASQPSQ